MICLCQDSILEKRIGVEEELKLETLWTINLDPLNIFEKFESTFITLRNLKQFTAVKAYSLTKQDHRIKKINNWIKSSNN